MEIVEIKNPVFKVLIHKDQIRIENETRRLFSNEGWYPVGPVGRKGNVWVQTLIKESADRATEARVDVEPETVGDSPKPTPSGEETYGPIP